MKTLHKEKIGQAIHGLGESQCLLGKARDAQNDITDLDYDYATLKTAVLEAFQLTPETYRVRFRTVEKQPSQPEIIYLKKCKL